MLFCPPTSFGPPPLHRWIYFCATSLMRHITADYLIPPGSLTRRLCRLEEVLWEDVHVLPRVLRCKRQRGGMKRLENMKLHLLVEIQGGSKVKALSNWCLI